MEFAYSKSEQYQYNTGKALNLELIDRFCEHYKWHIISIHFLDNVKDSVNKWLSKYNSHQKCIKVIDIKDRNIYYEIDGSVMVNYKGRIEICPLVSSIPVYKIQDDILEILYKEYIN